jgi:D-inositol-3-phosphate glycosyltransferase
MAAGILAHRTKGRAIVTRRARIVLVTTFYAPVHGGAEMAARRLAAVLKERGHDIFVLTKRTDPSLPDSERVDTIPVERIGPGGPRRGGGKWTIIPWIFAALIRRRGAFDIIVVIDYRGIGIAAILAGRILRRPVMIQAQTEGVLSCENWAPALARLRLAPTDRVARLMSFPLRVAYRAADAMACISRRIESEALTEGVARDRVHYLPNTVDTARFHPPSEGERERLRRTFGWPGDRLIALFVGRLSREKGIRDLIDAWPRVSGAVVLVVVGPDMTNHPWNEGPAARALASTPGRDGRVIFYGPSDDPAPLYRAADLAIVPSHWESFGISAAEAMSSGLAVIASAVGGLLDFMVDNQNGRLVPPRDPIALAAAIDDLAADAVLRQRLGTAARETMQRFDERVVLERFGAVIDQLAKDV